ncbi:MAG: AmmeMemoRadiSam system protein A [Thermodesulfobacteriota bacterium]
MDTGRELNREEMRRLLAVARETISQLVQGRPPAAQPADLEGLQFRRGAFVTLHRRGQLRGCIGNFVSDEPLVCTVQSMAVAAASQDPRFPPVRAMEMDEIDLEISVLSPLKPIQDVDEIEVGRHGIYIVSPRGRGVLLPQVATEYGWDRDTFLDHTCMKAGLRPGCWREPDVKILIFSAQVFGEKDLLTRD